ncbi:MAG: class I SAM-dependent methyltransferase [Acidobacteria bacterium]|nr:class I SAM-dependent methyltransferase [Acidobacteriota bacterium]
MSAFRNWREQLCCPQCRCPLAEHEGGLDCPQCRSRYEITAAGVPLLLTPADRQRFAQLLETASAARMQEEYARRTRAGWRARLWRGLSPPLPVYHNPAEPPLPRHPDGLNLWLGGAGRETPGFVNLDLAPFAGVHLVAHAGRIPFAENSCDAVACDALLEHVEDPAAVVAEIRRVLKPGGHVLAVVPFCHPWHGYPADYQRFSRDGLERLFAGFDSVSVGIRTGPTTALLTFFTYYWKLVFPVHARNPVRRWVNRALVAAWGWLSAPLRYLDVWLNRRPDAHTLANHLYLLARKPEK